MVVNYRLSNEHHLNLSYLYLRGAELMHMAVSSERVIADGRDAVGQFKLSWSRCRCVGVTGADIGGRRTRSCRVSHDDNLGLAGGNRCRGVADLADGPGAAQICGVDPRGSDAQVLGHLDRVRDAAALGLFAGGGGKAVDVV